MSFSDLNTLPELGLLVVTVFLIIYQSFFSNNKKTFKVSRYIVYSLLVSIIFFYCCIYESNYCIYSYNGLFVNDNLTLIVKLIISLSTFIVLLISRDYLISFNINNIEYYIFILLSLLGMFVILSSSNFISLYIGIELQSLCFYTLTIYRRTNIYSTEAGLKYFVLGALGSSLLLFGISIIYSLTGTINFEDIKIIISNLEFLNNNWSDSVYLLGCLLIIVSLLFKLGAVPFHNWLPDVYQGAPTSVTAFFSIVPKISLIGILIKLFIILFNSFNDQLYLILSISSVLSIIVGSLSALFQKKIKRLLAYSAITHVGYILIGFICCNFQNYISIITYIIIYIIMSILCFSILFNLNRIKKTRRGLEYIEHIEYISELQGLGIQRPYISFIFAITLFSMAGIPPLAGFFSKYYILFNAIQEGYLIVSIIAIVFSVVSAVYYIRLIKLMFFESKSNISFMEETLSFKILSFILILFILSFLFSPDLLVSFVQNIIESLYNIYL